MDPYTHDTDTQYHSQFREAHQGQYRYLYQLQELDSYKPERTNTLLPAELKHIEYPVNLEVWHQALSSHPDQHFFQYILSGLKEGLRIGFQHRKAGLKWCTSNMASKDHSAVVSEYLAKELHLNRLVRLSRSKAEAFSGS